MRDLPPVHSRRNPLVQQFRRARDGGEPLRFLAEGVRFVEEAATSSATVETVLITDELATTPRGERLVSLLKTKGAEVRRAAVEVLDAATSTGAPQGVVALVQRAPATLADVFSAAAPFVVIAAGVSDPGNMGTLLRTASAAGATGFITLEDTVSPWNDKALRSSAGAIFKIALHAGARWSDVLPCAKRTNTRVVATSASGGERFDRCRLTPPIALVLGSEGFGVPEPIQKACDSLVRIPLAHGVESLNVAAAGAILCFEVARQGGLLL